MFCQSSLPNKSGNPLDSETNIKLVHQQPRFSRSGTMAAELSPLVRHNTLRDFGRVERMRCNTLTGQQHLIATTMDSNRRSLVRPLSQPAQYLARSTSTPTVVSNSLSTDSVLGESQHGSHSDTNKEPPQVELTLVYVSPSAQLLVHIHRLSNVPTSRYGKESVTYVKVRSHGVLYWTQSNVASHCSACVSSPIRTISRENQLASLFLMLLFICSFCLRRLDLMMKW